MSLEKYKFKGRTPDEIEKECKELFITHYVNALHTTHDGYDVDFKSFNFDHAFKEGGVFHYARGRAIFWLKDVLSVKHPSLTKEEISHEGKGDARLYLVPEHKYLIVLRKYKGAFYFSTHYILTEGQLAKKLSLGGWTAVIK